MFDYKSFKQSEAFKQLTASEKRFLKGHVERATLTEQERIHEIVRRAEQKARAVAAINLRNNKHRAP